MMEAAPALRITITLASDLDIPTLAEINRLAYSTDLFVMCSASKWPNKPMMTRLLTDRLQRNVSNPDAQVFRACDDVTGEVLGLVTLTLRHIEDGDAKRAKEKVDGKPKKDNIEVLIKEMGQHLNVEVVMAGMKHQSVGDERFKGVQHYTLGSFAVSPQHQGKGIGSALLNHCLQIVDAAKLPVRLDAFAPSHDMYLRFGFEDFAVSEVDLAEFGKRKFCGYGVYRQTSMVRQARSGG